MVDRVISHYKNEIYVTVDYICFVIFVACYHFDYQKDQDDSQPDAVGEEFKKTPQGISKTLPETLSLMSSSDKLVVFKNQLKNLSYIP